MHFVTVGRSPFLVETASGVFNIIKIRVLHFFRYLIIFAINICQKLCDCVLTKNGVYVIID